MAVLIPMVGPILMVVEIPIRASPIEALLSCRSIELFPLAILCTL